MQIVSYTGWRDKPVVAPAYVFWSFPGGMLETIWFLTGISCWYPDRHWTEQGEEQFPAKLFYANFKMSGFGWSNVLSPKYPVVTPQMKNDY